MTTSTNSSPRLVLERMYQAEAEYLASGGPGTASFITLEPYFAPDVVLWQADSLPYGGIWRGHAGIEQFFVAMSTTWDRFDLTDQTFLSEANPLVVLTQVHARSRKSGEYLNFPMLQTITLREDRITEVRPFYWDTAAIADLCASPFHDADQPTDTHTPSMPMSNLE